MTAILIYTISFIWGAGLTRLRQISMLPILAIAAAMIVAITSVASPLLQEQVVALLSGQGSNLTSPTLAPALQALTLGLLYGLCLRVILLTVDFVVHFVSSTLAIEYLTGSNSSGHSNGLTSGGSAKMFNSQSSQDASELDETGDMEILPQSWSMLLLLIVISFLLMSGLLHRLFSEAVRGSQRLATLADNPLSLELCLDTARTVLFGMMESALSISLIFFLPLVVFSVAFDAVLLVLQRLGFLTWGLPFLRTLKIPFVVVISYLTVSLLGEDLVTLVMLGTMTGS